MKSEAVARTCRADLKSVGIGCRGALANAFGITCRRQQRMDGETAGGVLLAVTYNGT